MIIKDIYKLCQKLSLVKPQDLIEKESNCLTDQKLMVLLCSLTNVQGGLSNVNLLFFIKICCFLVDFKIKCDFI